MTQPERQKLDDALREQFHELTPLGSDRITTGLMEMAKRMDTGSPWALINNPNSPYWGPVPGKKRVPNSEFPLWRVVRASTAAPHFFAPESIDVGRWEVDGEIVVQAGEFIDSGVTTATNPALQLLQVAVLEGYGFGWTLGHDELLMVSVRTGAASREIGAPTGIRKLAAGHAAIAITSLMGDCAELVETMMQWISDSPTARQIDRQVGTLENDSLCGVPLLSYLRYNVQFDPEWMESHLNRTYRTEDLTKLGAMDDPSSMEELWDIGAAAAELQLLEDNLPNVFDLGPQPI